MNRHHYVAAFAAICILICLSACSDGITDPPVESGVIVPLTVGNQWWGKIIYYDPTGAAVDTSELRYRVSGDTLIDGETWAMWELSMNDAMLGSAPVRNTDQGYWSGSALQLKYPASASDTYQWVSSDLPPVVVPLSKLVLSSYLSSSSVVELPREQGDDIPGSCVDVWCCSVSASVPRALQPQSKYKISLC